VKEGFFCHIDETSFFGINNALPFQIRSGKWVLICSGLHNVDYVPCWAQKKKAAVAGCRAA
jgi:hypothetical protein